MLKEDERGGYNLFYDPLPPLLPIEIIDMRSRRFHHFKSAFFSDGHWKEPLGDAGEDL